MGTVTGSAERDAVIRDFLRRRKLSPDTEEYVAAREQACRWLAQFEPGEQAYMLEVVKAIRIETKANIDRAVSKLAKSIVKALGSDYTEAAYLGIGRSPASSGNHFLYPLLSELRLDNEHAKTQHELPALLERSIPLVFIDDIVGSGNQAVQYSKSLFKSTSQTAIYGCLYGLESGIQKLKSEGRFFNVLVANLLTEKDCAFTSNSQLFTEPASRKQIKRVAMKYGKRIYPEGPIGYDNSGLLITFPHNTPDNTLPIVWGGVESESAADHWEPLIARRKAPPVKKIGTLHEPNEVKLPSKPEFYESLHPFDSSQIVDVFVEPSYSIQIATADGTHQGMPKGFVHDARMFLEKPDRILVLSSPFGCGKTILSKYLDLVGALGERKKVAYVSAFSLKRLLTKSTNFQALFAGVEACIVDSVDELVIDDADAERNLISLCKCLAAARRAGTKIVLNLRVSDANYVENRTINAIFENLYADGDDLRLPVIRLHGFKKEQIVQWLAKYQSNASESPLTFDKIGEIHKRLGYAAGNPLFLYQLASYYQRRGKLESIYTVYQIYDEFVESTTTGRFELRGSPNRFRVWRLAPLYSVLLDQVACTINNSRNFRANSQSEVDPNVDWRLDSNDLTHSISDKELSNATEDRTSRLLIRDENLDRPSGDDRLELLNNYFFTRNGEFIGFKDNNILFFLVAKRLFRSISGLVNDGYDSLAEHLNLIAETKGHPQAIEILLKRIQAEGESFRAALSRRIDELIKDNRIIQLTSESLDRMTGGVINRDIILGIVLLHVKRGSYDQLDYFMTRMSWLTSAIKFQDSIFRTLIARFFRGIQLKEVEFRRLNCDEYNFKGTEFTRVKFIQCKLFSPIFDDTKHIDTQFSLCDFGGHREVARFSKIKGGISFDFCHIGRLMISLDDEAVSIDLRHCDLDELHIESANATAAAKIDLAIKESTVRRIFFFNAYLGDCKFRDSHIGQISDKNSKGSIDYSFYRPTSSINWGKETGRIRLIDIANSVGKP